jgi:thioredoxin-dependent peroxiredoxin
MASPTKGDKLAIGDRAPDFTLPDQNGQPVHLADVLARGHVVLYFYPKDESAGCTAEACSFRDQYEVFREAGAEVIGVSGDSVESHQKFVQHHRLPFILLSDAGGEVRKLYSVQSTLGFLPGRVTFVIDRDGIVRYSFNSQMNPLRHVPEALAILKNLAGEQSAPA